MLAVMKVGGGILRDANSLSRLYELIVANAGRRNFLVVSAFFGVTDLLLDGVEKVVSSKSAAQDLSAKLAQKHECEGVDRVLVSKKLQELERVLLGINEKGFVSVEQKELVLSFGERLSAVSIASYLNFRGVHAVSFDSLEAGIISDGVFEHAACDLEKTSHNLKKLEKSLKPGAVAVVTGFYGVDLAGSVSTFGRGGTDYSAGAVAAALDADVLEIFKDVDGFMSCDPKLVKNAVLLEEITFREAKELGYFGSKIIHPRTFDFLGQTKTNVVLKNFFNSKAKGTVITRHPDKDLRKHMVTAIAEKKGIAMIDVEGTHLVEVSGGAAKIFSAVAQSGASVDSISTSQVSISFTVSEKDAQKALDAINLIKGGEVAKATCKKGLALIGIVGENICGKSSQVASAAFKTLSKKGVEAKMISKSASDMDLSLIVEEKDLRIAVDALHEEFW